VAWPTVAPPQRASEVAWLSRSTARVPVRLRPARIPIRGGVGLTLYERVRSGLDARRPGDTEVGPRSSAAVGLLIAFILVNLGSVARLVRMQPAPAFAPASSASPSDATASGPSRPSQAPDAADRSQPVSS
jgi:hypothetical protein